VFLSTYYTLPSVRGPSVCVVHDMIFELFPGIFEDHLVSETIERKRRAIIEADRLICVSECTKRDLLKIYHVDAGKCKIVLEAAGVLKGSRVWGGASQELLYVGDWTAKYKNFEFLVRCLGSSAFSEFREYKLKVVSAHKPDAADMSRISAYIAPQRLELLPIAQTMNWLVIMRHAPR